MEGKELVVFNLNLIYKMVPKNWILILLLVVSFVLHWNLKILDCYYDSNFITFSCGHGSDSLCLNVPL